MRKTIFANGEYYHIYNRGVDKRDVFMSENDYLRFLTSMREFNVIDPIGSLYQKDLGSKSPNSKGLLEPKSDLVEIICYCLNPNHYHFILKQKLERGVEKFMHKVSMGYTNYFNKKYDRSGALFQGPFKSIHIDTNEYLLHLSVYVNRNNFIHGYEKKLGTESPNEDSKSSRGLSDSGAWQYSSYLDYIGKRNGKICHKEVILDQFRDKKDYIEFMDKTGEHLKDKKEMARYLLE